MAATDATARAQEARGLTIGERRSIRLEKVALYVMVGVALIAAVISFVALTWLGGQIHYGWAAPLIPLMVDGFGVGCTVGIARSQGAGEGVSKRLNEWTGLTLALALSVAGNVAHVLGAAPVWLMVAVAASPPLLLAFGVHLYGRAMARGLSAHIMVDDPTQLQMHVQQIGEPARKGPRARPAVKSAPPTVRAQPAVPVAGPSVHADRGKAAMRAEFDRIVTADPSARPRAVDLHAAAGATCDPATSRRWVAGWLAELDAARQPHLVASGRG
jgi:hypothetical protein